MVAEGGVMSQSPVIIDWDRPKAEAFGRAALSFRHDLDERAMFSRDALVEVLDRYPRERLGVFTMGEDPVDWRTWRRGTADGLTGEQLMRAAEEGRIWLNLRAMNQVLDSYRSLAGEIFGDLEANVPGLKTFRHDVGLLISSPRAHVFYHFDAAPVTLWQIRGQKRMWVYPVSRPYISEEQIEGLVLGERAEQVPYDSAWDSSAEIHDLTPGVMVSWPQNAPHRLVNGDMLNVSLSIEHLTPSALMRTSVLYANGLMRRGLGVRPRLREGYGAANLAKFALARAVKSVRRPIPARMPITFSLDPALPGVPQAI
jgi:hypothetical protein